LPVQQQKLDIFGSVLYSSFPRFLGAVHVYEHEHDNPHDYVNVLARRGL
jgi:hypothetical protein